MLRCTDKYKGRLRSWPQIACVQYGYCDGGTILSHATNHTAPSRFTHGKLFMWHQRTYMVAVKRLWYYYYCSLGLWQIWVFQYSAEYRIVHCSIQSLMNTNTNSRWWAVSWLRYRPGHGTIAERLMSPWKPCSWRRGLLRTRHFLIPISWHAIYTAVRLLQPGVRC